MCLEDHRPGGIHRRAQVPVVRGLLIYCRLTLVAWHSGRTSVSGRRTFPVPRSTCSWWMTTIVGKVNHPLRVSHYGPSLSCVTFDLDLFHVK